MWPVWAVVSDGDVAGDFLRVNHLRLGGVVSVVAAGDDGGDGDCCWDVVVVVGHLGAVGEVCSWSWLLF